MSINNRNKEIITRIKQSPKLYDKKGQRAQLLARNPVYLEERKKIIEIIDNEYKNWGGSAKFFLLFNEKGLDRPKTKSNYLYASKKMYMAACCKHLWDLFCYRWRILTNWNNDFKTLSKHINTIPSIECEPPDYVIGEDIENPNLDVAMQSVIDEWKDKYDFDWINSDRKGSLLISIVPETTEAEIRKIWPRIEKAIVEVFGYKPELKTDFSRNICWYDLNEEFKLPIRNIAELWIKHRLHDMELLALRYYRKNHKQSLKEDLHDDIAILGNDSVLLNKIKYYELRDNHLNSFKEDVKYYLHGIQHERATKADRFEPPFHALIRESIKRYKKYIELI